MVSAQWHLNPSAQRQSSAYPSGQRHSWASPSWEVSNIFNDGPCGWSPLAGATEGHLPHGSGHRFHIGHPSGLILHDAAGAHCHHIGLHHCCQLQGVWGCLMSIHWQWVPPQAGHYSPEAWRWCHLLWGFKHPCWWCGLWPCVLNLFLCPLVLSHPFPITFAMRSLFGTSGDWGGSAQQQWLAWRDVTLPSTQGIDLVKVPFWLTPHLGSEKYWAPLGFLKWGTVSSLATFTAASSVEELVDTGWALSGMLFSDWVVMDSSGRASHQRQPHWGRKCNPSLPLLTLRCSLPKGMVVLELADWLSWPKTGGPGHRPPSSLTVIPYCPSRQTLDHAMGGSPSSKYTALPVEPDGNSPCHAAH